MKPPFYCFCFGLEENTLSKFVQLGFDLFGNVDSGYFFCDGSSNWFGNAINSIRDDYDSGRSGDYKKQSYANINKKLFNAISDYWGMRPHYYYHEGSKFICSNNLLLVSLFSGAKKICRKSMLDCLLFVVPQNNRTWLEDIRVTGPGEHIRYSLEENSIEILKKQSCHELSSISGKNIKRTGSIAESYSRYSSYCEKELSEFPVSMSLSFGSDSRTVLSLIRKNLPKLTAYTFGDNDMIELKQVRQLATELGLQHESVPFSDSYSNFNSINFSGAVLSGFYMNPFRVHYYSLYKRMEGNRAAFEGILGSEFIKAELAQNAMISTVQADHLRGLKLDEAVRKEFGNSKISDELTEHGKSNQEDYWNSDDKIKVYAEWALSNIPSFIFAPIYSFLYVRGVFPFSPFLDRNILATIFADGYGITSYNSATYDHPGPIRAVIPEAIAAKHLDKRLYNTRLSRFFSFRECLSRNKFLLKYIIYLRRAKYEYGNREHSFGQVKNWVIDDAFGEYMENRDLYFPYSDNSLITKVNGTAATIREVLSDEERVCEIIRDNMSNLT
ncbi:MAG: hypothetical protein U5O15_02700 [Candidatus Krumholzibacteriota bacterium]|nr:hypothetical protein [Candidatus Krumholzibacteriota bacterium]